MGQTTKQPRRATAARAKTAGQTAGRSTAAGQTSAGQTAAGQASTDPERPDTRVLTDPRAMRALAHPARLAVLEELNQGKELTATDCAAVAGLSASAMSYHLRALEKWGFVERVETSEDGRERPWRSTAKGWRIDALPTPVAATAADAVAGAVLERFRGDLSRWFQHESEQPQAWKDAALLDSSAVWITAEEAAELLRLHEEALQRFRDRSATERPEGSRRVRVARLTVPLEYE